MRALIPILVLSLLAVTNCRKEKKTEPWLYLLIPLLAGAGERPTTPDRIRWSYYPITDTLVLEWDPTVDPDTDIEGPVYRIYVYEAEPPLKEDYYNETNLMGETTENEIPLFVEMREEPLYFIITSYDGASESQIDDYITVLLRDESHWEGI